MRQRRAVWPLDPASGGTWIGANDAGLAMVILNRNPRPRSPEAARPRSRGTIVPALLGYSRFDTVLASAIDLAADDFEPFTLLVLQDTRLAIVKNLAGRVVTRRSSIGGPVLVTSSSLGDHRVSSPRRALFRRLVLDNPAPLRGQAAFHRHTWAARPEVSVCMSRADARTVSRTVLDLTNAAACLEYTPLAGARPSRARITLPLVDARSR